MVLGIVFAEVFKPGVGINMHALSSAAVDVGNLAEKAAMPGFFGIQSLVSFQQIRLRLWLTAIFCRLLHLHYL